MSKPAASAAEAWRGLKTALGDAARRDWRWLLALYIALPTGAAVAGVWGAAVVAVAWSVVHWARGRHHP